MRLVGILNLFTVVLFLSTSIACRRSVPIAKPTKHINISSNAPSTEIEPLSYGQPVPKQELKREPKQDLLETAISAEPIVNVETFVKSGIDNLGSTEKPENTNNIVFDDINFDLDSYAIREVDKLKLQSLANFLEANPGVKVKIIGNCDERGTVEYNLVLGERRAYAARSYLLVLGVAENALSSISYGKEKPKVDGHDSDSWFINRNCQFLPE